MKPSVMRSSLCCALVALLSSSTPVALGAQRPPAPPAPATKTVLFVCEHGTVKSLLAKVLFAQYAKEAGLRMRAESRGTKADSIVPTWMMRGLGSDGVVLGGWRPRQLGPTDLASASHVVSFDVPAAATAGARRAQSHWNGMPSVMQDYAKGRDAIKIRVRQLVDSLKRSEQARETGR